MKRSEVAEIVMMLMAAFPHAKTTASTSAVYERALEDLDVEAGRKAVQRLMATSKFMPTIAEIREVAYALQHGRARSGEEAYAIVLRAVRRFGFYGTPRFTDPHIQRAIGVWGSWSQVCLSPDDDAAGRARFIELYEQLARDSRANASSGVSLPPPPEEAETDEAPAPRLPPAPPPTTGMRLVAPVPRIEPDLPPREPRRYTAEELQAELDALPPKAPGEGTG
jgi:hypothetical protein